MVKRGIPKKHLRKAFSIVASESIEFTWFKTYTNNWFSIDEKNPIHNVGWMVGATTKKSKNNKFICIKVIKLNRMKHGTIKKPEVEEVLKTPQMW